MLCKNCCVLELKKIALKFRVLSFIPTVITNNCSCFEFNIQKYFLYSAIAVRKLCETQSMNKLRESVVDVMRYPYIGDEEWVPNVICVDNYDSQRFSNEKLKLSKVYNSIVHSHTCDVIYHRKKHFKYAAYLGVSSDKDQRKYLYVIAIKDWIELLDLIVKAFDKC